MTISIQFLSIVSLVVNVVLILAGDSESDEEYEHERKLPSPVCFVENWTVPVMEGTHPLTRVAIERLMDDYTEGIISYRYGLDALSMSLYNLGVVCSRRQIQCFKSHNFRFNYLHRKVSPSSKCEQEIYSWHEGIVLPPRPPLHTMCMPLCRLASAKIFHISRRNRGVCA